MFKILGVPVARDKLRDPGCSFAALGVQITLLLGPEPGIVLANKSSRLEEIHEMVGSLVCRARLTKDELQRLKGKLSFYNGFVASKLAALAASQIELGDAELARSGKLSGGSLRALEWLNKELPGLKPRELRASDSISPVLLFSDAAELEASWGVGGIVLDVENGTAEMYAADIPSFVIDVWAGAGAEQLICQAEAYAAIVCYYTWAGKLSRRR
eukprot:3581238-Amphidinium_carterae.1